jgi:hypothetical protein
MGTKVKTTVHLDINMFKVESLKTLMAKNGIDFERAVSLEDDEPQLTEELQDMEVEVEGSASSGWAGSYYDPPEEPEMEITHVKKIKFADKEIDIDEAFDEDAWSDIEMRLWEQLQADHEYAQEYRAEQEMERRRGN